MGTRSSTLPSGPLAVASPHSAAAAWSGYIYQGHIALSHCLKLLAEDFERYQSCFLQLESVDDFTIFDENKQNPISIHQVKAKASTTLRSYSKALEELNDKKSQYLNTNCFYFHVAKPIDREDDTLAGDIHSDIQASYPHVTLYNYENNEHHLLVSEDLAYLRNQTNSYLNQHNNARVADINAYLGKMHRVIPECILTIHSEFQNGSRSLKDTAADPRFMIPLKNFHDILVSPLIDEDRFHALTHLIIHSAFTEAANEARFKNHKEKIGKYHEAFLKLSLEQVRHFAQSLWPHMAQDYSDMFKFHNSTPNIENLRYSLIDVLANISITASHNRKGQLVWKWDMEDYCATSIQFYSPATLPDAVMDVSIGILKNALLNLEHLYETSFFVTQNLNASNILEACHSIIDVPYPKDDNGLAQFTKFKALGLISQDNAKNKLVDSGDSR